MRTLAFTALLSLGFGTQAQVLVLPKVWLDGPYDQGTGLMRDDLRVAGLLPYTESLTLRGFSNIGGGGETTTPAVLAVTGSDAVVDWIRVELRLTTPPYALVANRNGLLQRDGDIVDADGVSPINLSAAPGNYHVVVRHRNHMGCMTAQAFPLSGTATTIDLRSALTTTYTNPAPYSGAARKTIGSQQLLWAGDVNMSDGPPTRVKYTGVGNDRDFIISMYGGQVITSTFVFYRAEDVNMDGVIKYTGANNDRDPILVNIGGNMPTNVIYEQVP